MAFVEAIPGPAFCLFVAITVVKFCTMASIVLNLDEGRPPKEENRKTMVLQKVNTYTYMKEASIKKKNRTVCVFKKKT